MKAKQIDVRYRCKCMDAEVVVMVRAREEGEDIAAWMENLQIVLGHDHHCRSPSCTSPTMEYVKVPLPGDESAPLGSGPDIH